MTLQLECPVCKTKVPVVERWVVDGRRRNGDRDTAYSPDFAKCPKCQREFTQAEIEALALWK